MNKILEESEMNLDLGIAHLYGLEEFSKDSNLALRYLQKSEEASNLDAILLLGDVFFNGEGGIKVDKIKARDYYLKASKKSQVGKDRLLIAEIVLNKELKGSKEICSELFDNCLKQPSAHDYYILGLIKYHGVCGIEKDLKWAIIYMELSSTLGYTEASLYLGKILLGDKNIEYQRKGLFMLKDLIERRETKAMIFLSDYHYNLSGNKEKSYELLERAVELGDIEARTDLASKYINIESKKLKAIELLISAAQDNDSVAALFLAKILIYGDFGIKKDIKKGIQFLKLSSDLCNSDAHHQTGLLFLYGIEGLNQSISNAVYWFTKGADGGCIDSIRKLGNLYYNGHTDFERDIEKGVNLLEMGAYLNDRESLNHLTSIYFKDEGLVDVKKLIFLLRNSIITGYVHAIYLLSTVYSKIEGASSQKAFLLMKEASERNNEFAKCYMGKCYVHGINVEKNIEIGLEHFKQAYNLGNIEGLTLFSAFSISTIPSPISSEEDRKSLNIALSNLNFASLEGCSSAKLFLSKIYFDGIYIKQNPVVSLILLKEAYDLGNKLAEMKLIEILSNKISFLTRWDQTLHLPIRTVLYKIEKQSNLTSLSDQNKSFCIEI